MPQEQGTARYVQSIRMAQLECRGTPPIGATVSLATQPTAVRRVAHAERRHRRRITITANPSSGRCSGRSFRGDKKIMPNPRTTHQNAIATGSVEPNGSGAAATVAKRIKDEIRFAGAGVAVLIFHRWPREQLGPIRKNLLASPIDQIAIQQDGQVINGSFKGLLMLG